MEYSDIYDSRQNRTGKTIVRGEKLSEGEYIQASVAVVKSDGHILVTRRHPDKTHGGMWEFPGGGSSAGEDAADTLYRELEEETGIRPYKEQVRFLKTVFYEPYHLFLQVYLVETEVKLTELRLQETEITQAMFVTPAELEIMLSAFTEIDQKIYKEISEELDSEQH